MKDYYIQINKDGVTQDIGHVKADNLEGAISQVNASAIGRGFVNFQVLETDAETFRNFRQKKIDEAKKADAVAQVEQEKANEAKNEAPAESETQEESPPAGEAEKPIDPQPVGIGHHGGPAMEETKTESGEAAAEGDTGTAQNQAGEAEKQAAA